MSGYPSWNQYNTYPSGANVFYSPNSYVSLQAANRGHTPSSSPSWWSVIPTPGSPGVQSVNAGTGISVTGTGANPVVGNQGVLSVGHGVGIADTGTAQNPVLSTDIVHGDGILITGTTQQTISANIIQGTGTSLTTNSITGQQTISTNLIAGTGISITGTGAQTISASGTAGVTTIASGQGITITGTGSGPYTGDVTVTSNIGYGEGIGITAVSGKDVISNTGVTSLATSTGGGIGLSGSTGPVSVVAKNTYIGPGTGIITAPANSIFNFLIMAGGGGGSTGGNLPGNNILGGSGGGSGQYIIGSVPVASGTVISYDVGVGGGGSTNITTSGAGSGGADTTIEINGFEIRAGGGQGAPSALADDRAPYGGNGGDSGISYPSFITGSFGGGGGSAVGSAANPPYRGSPGTGLTADGAYGEVAVNPVGGNGGFNTKSGLNQPLLGAQGCSGASGGGTGAGTGGSITNDGVSAVYTPPVNSTYGAGGSGSVSVGEFPGPAPYTSVAGRGGDGVFVYNFTTF